MKKLSPLQEAALEAAGDPRRGCPVAEWPDEETREGGDPPRGPWRRIRAAMLHLFDRLVEERW